MAEEVAKWKAAQEVAARELLLQQLAEQQRQRQLAEKVAKCKAAQEVAARGVLLQQLAEQQRQRQAAEKTAARKVAEAIAAKEFMVQQFTQHDRQRQVFEVEEKAQRQVAEAERTRQQNQQLQQLADQEALRQAAAVQAAVAAEPFYHDPPRHIDIDTAIQEHNRREQEWIQRMNQM